MKPLVVLRTVVQTAGVLAGAWLVFTGLANLPRLFLGIAVILAGIALGSVVNLALKRRGEYIPPAIVVDPREDSRVLRILLQPEVLIVVFGFFFNFFWEVSQIPMYTGINRGVSYFGENTVEMKLFFVETFWRAAFLDALLVVGAHLLTMVVLRNRFWFVAGGRLFGITSIPVRPWVGYVVATAICVGFLIYLEISAYGQGLWEYSRLMPTLFTKIGLTPVGGLLVSPTLVYLLTRRVARPGPPREADAAGGGT
jgi:hypothetical protein